MRKESQTEVCNLVKRCTTEIEVWRKGCQSRDYVSGYGWVCLLRREIDLEIWRLANLPVQTARVRVKWPPPSP